jgi:phosphatidate cytidylyltransferase
VGFLEYCRLARSAGQVTLTGTGAVAAAALATMPLWQQWLCPHSRAALGDWGTLAQLVLAAGLALLFLAQMARYRTAGAIGRVSATMLGVVYLGLLGATALALRLRWGLPTFVLFLAVVKLTDIGAYFAGSRLGRHKLIPWLSPGKSWEGLAGGVLAAVVVSVLLNLVFAAFGTVIMSWRQAAAFGVLMAIVGQFGDLCESLLKRDARSKDSGALVPSFGGVLDILDSVLLAAPAAYAFLALV